MSKLIEEIIRSLENGEWGTEVVMGTPATLVLTHETKPCSFTIDMYPSTNGGRNSYLGGDLAWCEDDAIAGEITLAAERGRHFKRNKNLLALEERVRLLFLGAENE